MKKIVLTLYIGVIISGILTNTFAQDTPANKTSHQKLSSRFFTIDSLHNLWDELLQEHVSHDGKVNYSSFKNDREAILNYINVLTLLSSKDEFKALSKNDKLAYWINAYNALTVDLIIRNYPVKSIKDIKDPWNQKFYTFNGEQLSLNQIEHDILRKMDEPRIHFAIVCASQSCPKLSNEAYIADKLEQQLTDATKDFLNDKAKNKITNNDLELSKIFKWFAKDFKQNGSLIDFLNQYAEVNISEDAKIKYRDYNWDLND
ncbi:DUF547 domain-containing protein [Hanstruepera marina]|uniref:DUF547 domain-containing protein n=1 Tax=Hanstruepera marina TaxID=2873265 RepID=UPI001CA71430|nr:DUF547 domain-containing protein [Hanstruepera marina]